MYLCTRSKEHAPSISTRVNKTVLEQRWPMAVPTARVMRRWKPRRIHTGRVRCDTTGDASRSPTLKGSRRLVSQNWTYKCMQMCAEDRKAPTESAHGMCLYSYVASKILVRSSCLNKKRDSPESLSFW